jgi:hypothetical protein
MSFTSRWVLPSSHDSLSFLFFSFDDSHFRDLSTRSSSALVKSILVDFIKRNYLPLPSDDIVALPPLAAASGAGVEAELSTLPQHNDYTLFDRLFFITIVLCSVFPGPITSSSTETAAVVAAEGRSNSVPISKPQYTLSVALQALVESPPSLLYTLSPSLPPSLCRWRRDTCPCIPHRALQPRDQLIIIATITIMLQKTEKKNLL